MNGKAAALGSGADGFEEVFAGAGARFSMNDDVGRNNFGDAALDVIAGSVGFFEADGAWNTDGHVDEIALAGAAQTDAVDAEDAFELFHCGSDLLL